MIKIYPSKISVIVILFICVSLFNLKEATAQDIHFSQFDQAPLFLNPALTCLTADFRGTINYRDQWGSIGTPFRTGAASVELALLKKRGKKAYLGTGLSFFSDKSGDIELSNTQIRGTINAIVPINETNTLSAGLQGGYGQVSYSPEKMRWQSQYDGTAFNAALPGEAVNNTSSSFGDFSFGVNWSYGKDQMYISANNELKFNLGMAMYHLNTPTVSFYNKDTESLFAKYSIHGNSTIGLKNTNLLLVPSFMMLFQGPSTQYTLGTMLKYVLKEDSKYTGYVKGASVGAGVYMRAKDAIITQVLLEFGNYGLGISYDINTSDLRAATNARGGFEVMLRYRSPNPFLYQSKAQF